MAKLDQIQSGGSFSGNIRAKTVRIIGGTNGQILLADGTVYPLADILNSIGTLPSLDTDAKQSLVDAVNEVEGKFDNLPVYNSLEEANVNLGAGKYFRYSKENIDGVPSPNSNTIAKT